ncbi:MAG: extracellular solute-binding protein [Chloroflexia bacterium]|nr:extracellular solute-binding protein [Chloroflexia bacterium]
MNDERSLTLVRGTRGMTRRRLLRRGAALGLGASALASLRGNRVFAVQEGEPVALTIWLEGEPGAVTAFSEIIDEYMQENPNVDVTLTFFGSDLFNPTLVPALNAGEGPDIWAGGTGPGQPAAIIEAGHALDLSPYFCALGWNEIIPEGIVNYTSSDGKLWAVGDSVESTVMFYNKEIFEQNGLGVPVTWDELMTACGTLQSAGFAMPIGLGGADKYPISWWQSLLWGRYAGPEGIDNVMFGDGRWDEEAFVQATAKLKELNDAGCFGPNALAEIQNNVEARFWRGEIPMVHTGPWIIGPGIDAVGEGINKFSAFQVPPPVAGTPIYPTEDIGTGWYVNAAYEHPDVAADLLDFVFFRDESRQKMLESGDNVPVGELDLENVELPVIVQEVFALSNEYRQNGTIHAFLDTVTPASMTDVSYDGLQAVLAGQMSPEDFTATVQSAWEAAKAENEHLLPGGVTCS